MLVGVVSFGCLVIKANNFDQSGYFFVDFTSPLIKLLPERDSNDNYLIAIPPLFYILMVFIAVLLGIHKLWQVYKK